MQQCDARIDKKTMIWASLLLVDEFDIRTPCFNAINQIRIYKGIILIDKDSST